jgi:hypothetical protein
MTSTEFVTAVKDHIGDRQSGRIGSQTVDAACLASVNKAIRHIAKIPNFNPAEQQESGNIAVTSGNYSYSTPTFTHGTIKSIISVTSQASGETTGRFLEELPRVSFSKYFPLMDSSRTGRPNSFTMQHKTTILLYPWPDGNYTVSMLVNCFPNELGLGEDSPYDEIWDEAIEAYATFDVFAKLQQTQDASSWFAIYRVVKGETLGTLSKFPSRTMDIKLKPCGNSINYGVEPGLDPFIRSVR